MRTLSFFLAISLYASVSFAQRDTTRQQPRTPEKAQVLIPGIDSPTSSPGALMQSSPQPNAVPPDERGKPKSKTNPPSDPRAFGVGIPVGKAKKDTLH